MSNRGYSLAVGSYLATNDYLCSADGSHFAIMQQEGNLVIYRGNGPTNQGAYVWDTRVVPGGDPHFFAILQLDGTLTIYRGSDPMHQGAFVWGSPLPPAAGQYVATLQNDGNLVVLIGPTEPIIVAWSALPPPSITLTITNQLSDPLSASVSNATWPGVTLNTGQSGSLSLPLNATTPVSYSFVHRWEDPVLGATAELQSITKYYTVATSDKTLTAVMVVSGGSGGWSYPTFTETLPTGVTESPVGS